MANSELEGEINSSRSIQSGHMTGKVRIGRAILATFIAALGPLSFGYCLGYSSSALVDLRKDNVDPAIRLSVDQGSWFAVSCYVVFFLAKITNFSSPREVLVHARSSRSKNASQFCNQFFDQSKANRIGKN